MAQWQHVTPPWILQTCWLVQFEVEAPTETNTKMNEKLTEWMKRDNIEKATNP